MLKLVSIDGSEVEIGALPQVEPHHLAQTRGGIKQARQQLRMLSYKAQQRFSSHRRTTIMAGLTQRLAQCGSVHACAGCAGAPDSQPQVIAAQRVQNYLLNVVT